MKAARLHQRGGPEQIVVEDAPIPQPKRGEIRIRVSAAAITPGELTWDQTYQHPDGTPRIPTIPGHDVAGVVDALGADVTDLAIGQTVYALVNFPLDGSAAQYVVVPAADVAIAPKALPPIRAAALPLSALTAWQALFDHGKLLAGQRVLIHGGAGGVGGFAVQLAKWRRAHVIATASKRNLDAARDFGADEVIDYAADDFEQKVRDVDLVFDTVGGDTLAKSLRVIRPGGTLVSIAGEPDRSAAAKSSVKALFFIVEPNRTQLGLIASIVDEGSLRVTIQETFPLDKARQAFERSLAGHLSGKVILQIDRGFSRPRHGSGSSLRSDTGAWTKRARDNAQRAKRPGARVTSSALPMRDGAEGSRPSRARRCRW